MDVPSEFERIWRLPWPDGPAPPPVAAVPGTAPMPSTFPVAEVAAVTGGAATAAAVAVEGSGSDGDGGGSEPGTAATVVDTDHALADWRARVLVDGEAFPTWAPLSGRYRSATGRWVQLHCNFPHHATGVAERLGVPEDRAAFEAAIATLDPFELEDTLRRDGMICAAYRTIDEWADHPHAAATADLPLIEVDRLGPADPGPRRRPTHRPAPDDPSSTPPATVGAGGPPGVAADPGAGATGGRERPLSGIRVVDCSRVLAGPVCGRTMAAHGATVMRVGAAHLPAVDGAVVATGFGKRNTDIDLRTERGRSTLTDLLAGADVFVDAYRPGALAGHGFPAERVAEIRPGIVVVELCAFDWIGPWAGRRGFDSIVQSTTGIAMAQAELLGRDEPFHLPVQALDFATGYLAAMAGMRLLDRRRTEGGSWRARLSLLRTRNWLVGARPPAPFDEGPPPEVDRFLHTVESPFGTLTAVRPVAGRWDLPPSPLGTHPPAWP